MSYVLIMVPHTLGTYSMVTGIQFDIFSMEIHIIDLQATTKAQMEAKMDNGLIQGHAYSLTDVRKIKVKGLGNAEVELVRVRNPWGNEREWSGAWSDR